MTTTKSFRLIILLSFFFIKSFTQNNPTGIYIIGKGLKEENSMLKGNHGEIRVKKLSPTKVAIALYVLDEYNIGDFVDTLILNKNKAIYSKNSVDSSCKIYFNFLGSQLLIKQTSKIYPYTCGFGRNVDISGLYRKVSPKVPVITNMVKEP